MAKYRDNLPQLGAEFFMTDGASKQPLFFSKGQDLPDFAAFHLFRTAEGVEALGLISFNTASSPTDSELVWFLETPTWRASA
jgi:homocysteine S-methyltransferase